MTDLAERQIKGLVLAMRDEFPEASATEIRSGTLAFLSLAKMGNMEDKKKAFYVNILSYLAGQPWWEKTARLC